jgi:hypothetical protein
MGCEASETYQPYRKGQKLQLRIDQPKKLYHGFCFGSKTLQVYIPSNRSVHFFPPIEELPNESLTMHSSATMIKEAGLSLSSNP